MTEYTFYGGPLDGEIVPEVIDGRQVIIVAQHDRSYYYVRCDDEHQHFEYAGEGYDEDEL